MARFETLTCDWAPCGKEERVPTHGWISTAVTKGSTTEASSPVRADFCGIDHLFQYFGAVAMQQGLEEATDEAPLRLLDDTRGKPQ